VALLMARATASINTVVSIAEKYHLYDLARER
jgi:hypothetical protein